MITKSGFSMALIQKKDAGNVDYSTIFFFNVFIDVLLYLVIFIFAGYIVNFHDKPLVKKNKLKEQSY
jgi:hypothetical protein